MSNSKDKAWQTKYGRRRVRQEAPTLEEAIFAAQGVSDDSDEQAEFAASLMGLPVDHVRRALAKVGASPRVSRSVAFAGPASAPRSVVVERKPSRRIPTQTSGATTTFRRTSASH